MSDLLTAHCQQYSKGALSLDSSESLVLLDEVTGWTINDDNKSISRCFKFKDYHQTIAFVNATAWISHEEDHHPELQISYNRCHVTFTTHSINGLSRNDFICAAKFNALLWQK